MVACIDRRNGHGGSSLHDTFSLAPQKEQDISLVTGQPSSMVGNHKKLTKTGGKTSC